MTDTLPLPPTTALPPEDAEPLEGIDPTRIAALAAAEIERITLTAPDPETWRERMERVLTVAHTTAAIAAIAIVAAQVGAIRAGGLPPATRAALRRRLQDEIGYLRRMVAEWDTLSPAQRRARAMLYAGGVRVTYYDIRYGDWDVPDHLMPGRQACDGNCRCTIRIYDNGDGTGVLVRDLNGENHCRDCPYLAGSYLIWKRRR